MSPSVDDDDAPCPPTPFCATACACNASTDSPLPDDDEPHVSDCIVYDRDEYAFPSPILAIVRRAELDKAGRTSTPVSPRACGRPLKLFSLTAGAVPLTGLKPLDDASFDYYARGPAEIRPEYVSVETVEGLHRELETTWRSVYPRPIPPLVLRTHDLIAHDLAPCTNGWAFLRPTDNPIWDVLFDRGIDRTYRPINPLTTLDTDITMTGGALYSPQHLAASNLALNVFLELPAHPGVCEYVGAYVLQVPCQVTVPKSLWEMDGEWSVFDRVCGGLKQLGSDCPVLFAYYKWDCCFLAMAIETRNRHLLAMDVRPDTDSGHDTEYSSDATSSADSGSDTTEQSSDATSSAGYDADSEDCYLDLSECE